MDNLSLGPSKLVNKELRDGDVSSPAELKSIRSNIIAERLKQYHKQSTTFHENQKVVNNMQIPSIT